MSYSYHSVDRAIDEALKAFCGELAYDDLLNPANEKMKEYIASLPNRQEREDWDDVAYDAISDYAYIRLRDAMQKEVATIASELKVAPIEDWVKVVEARFAELKK